MYAYSDLGFSYSYNNAIVNDSTRNPINLLEVHAKYFANRIYAAFEFGNITYGSGNLKASRGYYLDLGYDLGYLVGKNWSGIPFFRWTEYNTAAETATGGDSQQANQYRKWMVGFAVKPIPNVVFKMDYGVEQNQLTKSETILFNLGTGYLF